MATHNSFVDISSIKNDVLLSILPCGEKYNIGWKSNLGKGAFPKILRDSDKKASLMKLAIDATRALSIQFASVDIIETDSGLMVLEVNSGIMMERFIQAADENYNIAKEIYKHAIKIMLKE